MTRGLLYDRFCRWLNNDEYNHIERKIIQTLIFATTLLILSGFIRATITHFAQTD